MLQEVQPTPESCAVRSVLRSILHSLMASKTNSEPMPALPQKQRVAVIGGGAAGCSAAYAMSLSPELFEVTLFERASVLGGMATSTEIGELIAISLQLQYEHGSCGADVDPECNTHFRP